ncbi:hypothetical protein [Psychroserpens algicola]|uniref:hypothetical protein n=1 Tax=Psychroserpens algicola TaxID=1719034 RepID=UPI001954F553|nr:hypothetical protein [Psychroserpens algicola]
MTKLDEEYVAVTIPEQKVLLNDKTDPLAILSAIKAVVDIANGIADFTLKLKEIFGSGDQQEIIDMLDKMNIKLDLLLQGQIQILDSIRNLRFVFREELGRAEMIRLHSETQSWIFALKVNILRIPDANSRRERKKIIKSINDLLLGNAGNQLFKSTFWGPGAFSTVAISYGAWLQATMLTNQKSNYIKAGLNQFEKSFKSSIENANKIEIDLKSKRESIEYKIAKTLLNKKVLISRVTISEPMYCDVWNGKNEYLYYLVIEGDLVNGFRGRKVREKGQWDFSCRVIHDHRYKKNEIDYNDLASKIEIGLDKFIDLDENKSYDPGGIISKLNSQRKNIKNIIIQLNSLSLLKEEIKKLINSIETVRQNALD